MDDFIIAIISILLQEVFPLNYVRIPAEVLWVLVAIYVLFGVVFLIVKTVHEIVKICIDL